MIICRLKLCPRQGIGLSQCIQPLFYLFHHPGIFIQLIFFFRYLALRRLGQELFIAEHAIDTGKFSLQLLFLFFQTLYFLGNIH